MPSDLQPPREWPTGLYMYTLFRALEDHVLQAVVDAGGDISRAQARLLAGIDPVNGTRLVALADRARVSKQTAVPLVDRLEEQGYVVRQPDPRDRRARLVKLSPLALELLEVARTAEHEVEGEWARVLGERRMASLRRAVIELWSSEVGN
ncbi:MarR family winged helix-turn-helix transcriptional regulator [Propionibacteriaceae bacterium G57]|uniref:MarR family winged helix-turn-helix transcriptional regulator n=1 Tax=Aestuariimicrobium sp. G57 TaxID=3418485 RepID=UPI003DA77452